MDQPLLDRLAAAIGHRPLSRRRALRRLGRAGVASVVAGPVLGTSVTLAQSADNDGDNVVPRDAGEAQAASEELVAPQASLEELQSPNTVPPGALRWLTDYDRSLWLNTEFGWSSLEGHVFDVRRFGAVGDGVTDDWAAFNTAIEAMSSPLVADTTTPYGRTLLVPPGRYRLSQSLVLTRAVKLVGAVGSGRVGDAVLLPDAGIVAIVVEATDPPVRASAGRRGEGSLIERLWIEAGAPTAAGTAGTGAGGAGDGADVTAVPGVWLRARAALRDCAIVGFPGDGMLLDATTEGDPFEGDGWEVVGCRVEACGGHGLFARGGSAGCCTLLLTVGNGGWGILDDSARGNTYLQCRAAANGEGAFAASGGGNRSQFLGCMSDVGQPPSSFADETLVVGGAHGAGYLGGNAWVADESRMLLRAQAPGGGDASIPTAPTLHLLAAPGQMQPHLRIGDGDGGRLAEFDAAGRLLIGPADLGVIEELPDAPDVVGLQPVQVQVSHETSGQAALRWVVGGESASWVAQARAFHEPTELTEEGGPPNPTARLVFQTPNAAGQEIDTLTLRQGRVGIGTVTPAAAALLDLSSASLGFLPPRLTTEERDAIPSPPEGLTIYNRTTRRLNIHDGDAWRELSIS